MNSRQIWRFWVYLSVLLAVETTGLVAVSVYSLVIGNVVLSLIAAVFAILCGGSLFFRGGLGGLLATVVDTREGVTPAHELDLPAWAKRIVGAGPVIWGVAGVAVLTGGVINAVRDGDRGLTVLCFPVGITLLSTALTYELGRQVARKRSRSISAAQTR